MDVNIKIEDLSTVKKKLSFEVPWEDVKKELDSAYNKVGKQAKVKGFRPGKAPRKILETLYKDQAEGEAISSMVSKHYWDAVEKKSIVPTSQPVIDQGEIKSDSDFSFSATVETKPEIEPKDYLELQLDKEAPAVMDEALNKRLDDLRNMYSTLEEIQEDKPVAESDFVTIDFQGSVDGKELDSMKAENYVLEIGSQRFIPGFEDKLIGLKKGDDKEFKITFPENYNANDLAGKEAVFKVKVKELKQKRIPELDDNFLKNFEKYETIDDLKNNLRQALEEENKLRVDQEFRRKLIDKLLENNLFEVPETLVERQLYLMMMNTQRRMAYNGMDPQKAAEFAYRMRDTMKVEAEKQVKTSLLLEAIAKKESIKADEEDIQKRFEDMASRYAQDVESVRKSYEKEDMMDGLKAEIVEQKTLDFIEAGAKINIVTGNTAEKES